MMSDKKVNILNVTFSIKTVVSIIVATFLFATQAFYVNYRLDESDKATETLKKAINDGTSLTFMLFEQLVDAELIDGPKPRVMAELKKRYKLD